MLCCVLFCFDLLSCIVLCIVCVFVLLFVVGGFLVCFCFLIETNKV